MRICKAPRKNNLPIRRECRAAVLPPKPDERLWKADEARAFEAGVRWFLAVSRAA